MANEQDRPLSNLVAQGWEIVGFSSGPDPSWGVTSQQVLLRRQRSHKLLSIRRKSLGRGHVVTEVDL